MADVFIAHRGSDAKISETLAKAIQEAGYEVWLDMWEIGLGDSIVGKMNEGLAKLKYLILCFSSDGVDAPWISREWMTTLARQLDGQSVKILPVRLSGGNPPAILADLRYADLVADWNKGLEEILSALAKEPSGRR